MPFLTPKTDARKNETVTPDEKISRLRYTAGISMKKKKWSISDDFGLTPLQLETRFWGRNYLDLV